MRRSETREHREILARAELITQALGLLGPDLSKPGPKRFDQIHLMTMLDNTAPQIMQVLGLCIRPGIGHQLSCAAISRR